MLATSFSSSPSATSPSSLRRLFALLWLDKRDLAVLFAYTVVSSILGLALPLASQALLNSIAAGLFLQPLVILSVVVLVGLLFSGGIRVVELRLVEALQQRLMVRTLTDLVTTLPKINLHTTQALNLSEVSHRYFDILTLQKSLAKQLLTLPSSLLQITVALVLLAFYSPYFVLLNGFILLGMGLFVALGYQGTTLGIQESKYKYKLAYWVQQMMTHIASLRLKGVPKQLETVTYYWVQHYLKARQAHYGVLQRQYIWEFVLGALVISGVLVVGGWLVLHSELGLGQLVAAELMTLVILNAFNKVVSNLESWYDLLVALHKLADLTELPREPQGGLPLYNDGDPPPSISFDLKKLSFTYPEGGVPVFSNLSLGIPKESRVALVGPALAGKSTLLQLLAGNVQAQHGSLTINGHSINDVSKIKLRQCMAYLGSEPLLVEGSIKENLLMGLALDTAQQRERFNEILHATGLMEALARFPNGLQTPLVANGTNLPKSLRQLIVLTRTLLDVPSCLLLDEAFNDMDHVMKERAMRALYQYTPHTTVVCVTRHLGLISLCDYVYVFDAGELVTQGTPEGLWQQQHPYLQGLQGKGLQQYSHLKQPLPTSNDGGLSL